MYYPAFLSVQFHLTFFFRPVLHLASQFSVSLFPLGSIWNSHISYPAMWSVNWNLMWSRTDLSRSHSETFHSARFATTLLQEFCLRCVSLAYPEWSSRTRSLLFDAEQHTPTPGSLSFHSMWLCQLLTCTVIYLLYVPQERTVGVT